MAIFDPSGPGADLMNFGFATMAAAGQPGATTLGALGQGGLGMNTAALQRAQTQNTRGEAAGKNLSNAMSLYGLNRQNAFYGMPSVNMPGVQNLMPQQPPSPSQAAPPPNSTGQTWSSTAGSSKQPSFSSAQMSPQNAAKMQELYPDETASSPSSQNVQPTAMGNYSAGAMDVARGLRIPQSADEATQAAALLAYSGTNPERQKRLEDVAEKNLEPQTLREGGQVYYPLGGGSISASKNVAGYNNQNEPIVASYSPSLNITSGQSGLSAAKGKGGRNMGAGLAPAGVATTGGQIRTGFSPEEEETQKNFFGPEATSYNGAIQAKYNLAILQNDTDTLNQNPGFLSTGAGGTARVQFAKSANQVSNQLFGTNLYDPDKIAAGESLFKQTGRLGFDMSKQLGAREPGVITQQAIKLNPNIENTPNGAQLITNVLVEAQQRIQDERAFKTQYYQQNGYHQTDAEQSFDSKFTPELYAKRATSMLKPIIVNTPAAAKQLLAGTKVQAPDGRIKVIPENVGLTPPIYHGAQPPQELPAQPVELDGE